MGGCGGCDADTEAEAEDAEDVNASGKPGGNVGTVVEVDNDDEEETGGSPAVNKELPAKDGEAAVPNRDTVDVGPPSTLLADDKVLVRYEGEEPAGRPAPNAEPDPAVPFQTERAGGAELEGAKLKWLGV